MIPELGHFALIVALCVALVQGTLPLIGAHRRQPGWIALARPAARAQALLMAVAFGCLTSAFVSNDFSVIYVAQHSNTLLPIQYRVAAVWGGHEGSLLLWVMMLSLWTLAVSVFSKQLPDYMVARVLGVLALVTAGFLLFILFTSNPFERLLPGADEGRDLNPLLQDPGLIIHPPMLYMGYVGFSVAYAFAVAALLSGQLDAAWARWSRPWTTAAWIFLTLGIALGSWWAYYELGWGGWWFWDPVENASFMPWLVGTALIHSLAVTEKRGSFKNWTVLLAIAAFSLSLLGTFLVRSGVLTSVHAFATDPRRGIFILVFLVTVIGSSLALFAWRAPKVGLGGRFGLLSRESLLLTNNVLLIVACASVLLGTLYPLLIDALGLGKLSVGPPYFDSVFAPLMIPALFLIGVAPFARWKQASFGELARTLRLAFFAAAAVGIVAPFVFGEWKPLVALGLLLAMWIVLAGTLNFAQRVQSTRAGQPFLAAALKQPRSFFGMHTAHVGIAVFVVGVTMVNGYQTEKDVKMEIGDTVGVGGYTFRFNGVRQEKGPNYVALVGDIDLLKGDKHLRKMHPEKRNYVSGSMPMTEAAIDTGLLRDVYVSLGEPIDKSRPDAAWAVRVYHKPFVDWIWGGCVLMAVGGLFALTDRRYRIKSRATSSHLGALAQHA
ncbi:heme lyase CcmF/NrfE family subunit [Propionivibrio sp.]|uniref:heme lyase CcmF/NrfE family subunit n=1 Tax=Propionivibrio sp. TaxID=2212460 RepID=UPI0025CF8B5E|nr:heme lyase CcmF/NrfE family subunit [Propionivibrio sp.]MBK7357087.1 heme lyase CcmF/NrfE family subunit [Propionivibrio sp.]MBK8401483.1 heme lyase CcmF/NrfE family subunit [Propionivibrio sp.]MBK8745118.1 heme lyase CcmF/NrfE family subunit [Propionivibrio sp.]MBK8894107.1 heme lyase CcmF/NrfE family subunit [Propionivibrio sp.]